MRDYVTEDRLRILVNAGVILFEDGEVIPVD